MENKVALYNANGAKIGETYARRARQLVNQQRAMWVDDTQTSIRFAPGMENMDTTDAHADIIRPNQLCFAPWHDGYYYPAVISDANPHEVLVAYLDGDVGHVSHDHILSVDEALEGLRFECQYGWAGFYAGIITSKEPIVFHYDDGTIEQTELRKLRGIRR